MEHVIEPVEMSDEARHGLAVIIKQLGACNYECEAGPLELNIAFILLKELIG